MFTGEAHGLAGPLLAAPLFIAGASFLPINYMYAKSALHHTTEDRQGRAIQGSIGDPLVCIASLPLQLTTPTP